MSYFLQSYSFGILIMSLLFTVQIHAQDATIPEFLEKWKHSEQYLLEIIEKMPADQMDYKIHETGQSFSDITKHIVSNMVFLSSEYLGGDGFALEFEHIDLSKVELIQLVDKAFDYAYETVEKLEPTDLVEQVDFFAGIKSKRQMLTLMNDHCSHHRGQLTTLLRSMGIDSPRYIGW